MSTRKTGAAATTAARSLATAIVDRANSPVMLVGYRIARKAAERV
jgi:hypothetical protein